jgi:hypothetical protein
MRAAYMAAAAMAAVAVACVPTLPKDPVPEEMEFDPAPIPPRVPQPTGLIFNTTTKRIDFSLAGLVVPMDCANQTKLSQAECEFDQYLQSLDGFPTVSTATAPASAALDPATFGPGSNNVVAIAKDADAPEGELQINFQAKGRFLNVRPHHWRIGETYWLAVRGFAKGVRTVDGKEVVGDPAQYLLKQETSLTCGASDANIDPKCPAFALLSQRMKPDDAAKNLLQLETLRVELRDGLAYESIERAGIPKDEVAVIWGFPVHSRSVVELDPSPAGMIVPRLPAKNQISVAVQGPVDPASVKPFVFKVQMGSVVVVDLTALMAGDLTAALPPVGAVFEDGNIVITGQSPFPDGDVFGLFFTDAIHDAPGSAGRSLVPSPVSKLLTLRGPLVGSEGRSTLLSVSDDDAAMLETGRLQLAMLFDDAVVPSLLGISRETLVYCYAFQVKQP